MSLMLPMEYPPTAGGAGAQPAPVPTADLDIRVLRGEARLLVPSSIAVHVAGQVTGRPDRLRLRVLGELFCDEMVLVYGRPLCWTGSHSSEQPSLPSVEQVFDEIFSLTSSRRELVTPAPRVEFPASETCVGWNYGAVLVRGDDPPWAASGWVHIHRHQD